MMALHMEFFKPTEYSIEISAHNWFDNKGNLGDYIYTTFPLFRLINSPEDYLNSKL